MIRVIVASNDNGSKEEVYFTEDFEAEASDFFYMGDMTITIDDKIDELPSCFPMDYVLRRQ